MTTPVLDTGALIYRRPELFAPRVDWRRGAEAAPEADEAAAALPLPGPTAVRRRAS